MRIILIISILALLHACKQDPDMYATLFKVPEDKIFAVVNIDFLVL